MTTNTYKISLDFNQILELVKQLSNKEKIELSKELFKETIDSKLTQLLNSFETDELTDEIINQATEEARAELYEREKRN